MNILQRLQRLEARMKERRQGRAVFKLADGSLFYTHCDPLTFLLKNDSKTLRGRIVEYIHSGCECDPITEALQDEIELLIQKGDG